uniref:Capsid protein n=1 Tax=Thin paspalum asymptomatic virus TaxID=1352511 RepID=S4WAX6_9TOMB|nr:coat protein [Thin paspalum asymptomatic virus]
MNRSNGAANARRSGKRAPQSGARRRARGKSVERRAAPIQYVTTVGPSQPRMGTGQGWQRISHQEIILQVTASTTSDSVQVVPIIPRLSLSTAEKPIYQGSAPHLRQMGDAFSIHRWRSLSFEWVPSCPTTTPGNLVLRFYPSYSTPTPKLLTDIMDSESLVIVPSISGATYRPKIDTRAQSPEMRNISITGFSALSDEDKGDFSVGRLVVGASKQAVGLQLGLLRMSYVIELRGATAGSGASA